jgi:hypothetical protein
VPSISQFRLATPAPGGPAPAPGGPAPAPDALALSAIPQFDAAALSATPQFDVEFYAPVPAPDAAALSATFQFDVDALRCTLYALLLGSVMPSTVSQGRRFSLQMPTRASCDSRRFLAWLNSSNV